MGKFLDEAGLTYLWSKIRAAFAPKLVWYATCDTAAATAAKVATVSPTTTDFVLQAGVMVNVKFSITNSAAVANLTLNVNGTGAKPIKYIYNNAINNLPGVGYLLANGMYTFRYDGTNWLAQLMYNTNDNTIALYVKWYNTAKAAEALAISSLVGMHSDGLLYQLAGSGDYFDLDKPLLWLNKALSANDTNYADLYMQMYDRNLGTYYTAFNTGAANKTVYLVGTVSGNQFTLNGSSAATYLTCNPPTSANNLYYIPIGKLGNQSSGKNYFFFHASYPVQLFAYINGAFQRVDTAALSSGGGGATPIVKLQKASTGSVSCGGSTAGSTTLTITAPTGYKIVGVMQVASNGDVVPAYAAEGAYGARGQQSSTITIWWVNTHAWAKTVTFDVTYLCAKDGYQDLT